MDRTIERPKTAAKAFGVGKTLFSNNYVLRDPAQPHIPGTSIPRLRPIPLGEKAIGFFSDEIAAVQDALGKLRGKKIVWPKKTPATKTSQVTA